MPGASGGPRGLGVDRHGVSPFDSLNPALFRRSGKQGGGGWRSGAQSRYHFNTIVVSRGRLAKACWKSARKARDITK